MSEDQTAQPAATSHDLPPQAGQGDQAAPPVAPAPAPQGAPLAHWREAILRVAGHYRIDVSPGQLDVDLAWAQPAERLPRLARAAGLSLYSGGPDMTHSTSLRLPVVVVLEGALAPFPLAQWAAVHADTADRAADADPDEDLGWFALTEIPHLL